MNDFEYFSCRKFISGGSENKNETFRFLPRTGKLLNSVDDLTGNRQLKTKISAQNQHLRKILPPLALFRLSGVSRTDQ